LILVRLYGGIGNQLFQYAAARRLAYKHKTDLKLDITAYREYKIRKYSLNVFNIKECIASPDEIERFRSVPKIIKIDGRYYMEKKKERVVVEKHFHFDPEILELPDNVYLTGYWQSEKYFKDIEDIIRQEFSIKPPQTEKDKEILKLIKATQSVALCVRRGELVTNVAFYEAFGFCKLDYYHRCISYISRIIPSAHFFVFSDDFSWAKKYLPTDFPMTFVDHIESSRSHENLRLMSNCRHYIISNTTFGWWGAWLNRDRKKIVCVPKKWFKGFKGNTKDLFPAGWVKIRRD